MENHQTWSDTDDVMANGHGHLVDGNVHSILGNEEYRRIDDRGQMDHSTISVDGHHSNATNGSLSQHQQVRSNGYLSQGDESKVKNSPVASVDPRSDNGSNNIITGDGGEEEGRRREEDVQEEEEEEEEEDHGPCGWGAFQFGCCQRFRTPKWFLLVITLCGVCQGMTISGFVSTVISTIEKRFDLSSIESGLIVSCYDIMFVLLVIPVSYLGTTGNKPRYIGWGILVLGIGSFVFSLPHFLSDLYDVDDAMDTVCRVNITAATSCTSQRVSLSNFKYFFFLGQLLHGAGGISLFTLAVVYLDENLPLRSSSLYSAIFCSGIVLGPAIGYMLGAELLSMYTDFDAGVDPDQLGLNVNNPKWVGAWWLGFLISGVMATFLSLPLLAFPTALPGSQKYAKERGAEVQAQKIEDTTGQEKSIRDVLLSIKILLANLPFMFINVAIAASAIAVSGFATFTPKFIEYQFGVSSSKSALLVGLAVVPGGGFATFLGGFLVSYFNLKVKAILHMSTVCAALRVVVTLCLLMSCQTGKFAGITTHYQSTDNNIEFLGKQLISDCNRDCGCREEDYYPMCGGDNVLYFSPCHAGCTATVDEGSTKHYTNCSCLNYNYNFTSDAETRYQGEFGKCDAKCDMLIPFMSLFGVSVILLFITSMPSLTATLRCVPDHQRALGLGIQNIVGRCLGAIPGPILFGKMFDLACLLWQKRCHDSGSCFFYDNRDMRMNLLVVSLVFLAVSALAFLLASCFYKAKAPDETIHVELERNQDVTSCQSSQNTIFSETPSSTIII